ncbi:hypothetical protein Patl1_24274 [Pistacia atlantica]|uniref:Uncharacterized protein n=1 Tax=Pistacia atlantica TaxID=434234 RepID=A0ACC0ZZ35_9ROSI|nr:hypothetical protein Patl1_24274 [Pistacia atlantica]
MMSNTLQADYLHDRAKGSIRFRIGAARIKKCKYIVLGVDTCADTVVGDEMRRGISGGQKRRLTTYATVLISLLQPAPETFELLDDIILMAEGKVVYQGLRDHVVEFFADWIQMDIDVLHATYYMGALFFGLVILLIDGIPELSLTTARLPVLFKQKELCFYPAWAYAIPATILKIPLLVIESVTWTCLTYYVIRYSLEAERFFRQLILLFLVHLTSISMFRFLASVFQTLGAVMTVGLLLNEFLASWWQKVSSHKNTFGSSNQGNFEQSSLGALSAFTLLFNIGFILALSFLKSPRSSRAMISQEKLVKIQGSQDSNDGGMVLPFEPLSVAFKDVKCYVDIPGPGVLTTLMGVSGAGKSTLLGVLPGRMATCYIEGEIKIGGYPEVQETFARVSGYCEQTDEFVNQVLEIIELDEIKDALVGVPGVIGPSTKQRKQLTVAVELVANPSIIFMDEPTSGFDAQGASIVMRAVKNVVETGRTIVCTDHQPNIDIFEAFDEAQKSSCEGVEYSTSWSKRFAFSNPLRTEWFGCNIHLVYGNRTCLIGEVLHKLIPTRARSYSVFAFWCTVLGPWKGNVTIVLPY